MPEPAPALTTTGSGFLLVLSIILPVAGILLAFVLGGRHVRVVVFTTMPFGLAIAATVLWSLQHHGGTLIYLLGAWPPPLGVVLRADGLSAVMLATTTVVICVVAIYAAADFSPATTETRAPFVFWVLLLAIWSALNTIFVGGDAFTLYVALELLTFAAVPLVSLDGRTETLRAALRYLLFALLGSIFYLLGTALLYGQYGTLDLVLLSQRIRPEFPPIVALALMTAGLLAKTALVPLHLWLPPAHAGAPAAASAILSGLVVKGSLFIILRLWYGAMPSLPGFASAQLLGALGTTAIIFGSLVALRQERLKLLIAYSTLAQIGYLFLMFPLALNAANTLESGRALSGGLLQAVSHATAKAAMFMAVGVIYAGLGHDRITGLRGAARALPLSILTFALGGVTLIGIQPSGASLAKEMLLQAASETGQWWWAAAIQAGGMLTAAYVVLVLAYAITPSRKSIALTRPIPRVQNLAAFALALCSLLLGLVPWAPYLAVPDETASNLFSIDALSKLFIPILGGAILAALLNPRSSATWSQRIPIARPIQNACRTFGRSVENADSVLCRWPTASISLFLVALLLGALMFAAM